MKKASKKDIVTHVVSLEDFKYEEKAKKEWSSLYFKESNNTGMLPFDSDVFSKNPVEPKKVSYRIIPKFLTSLTRSSIGVRFAENLSEH